MLGLGTNKSVRRRARTALLSGATVAAIGLGAIGASGAAAAPACNGSNITGQGASLQKVAQQQVWNPQFAATVCNKGTFPTVTYNSTGSGAGLKEWNHDGKKGSINTGLSWISTDDAPTTEQINNIISVAGGSDLVTIPIAQTGIVPVINPPPGCTVEALTNKDLEFLFRGNKKNWSTVETAEGSCNFPVTRVVRKDGSGTTYQFKNYLSRMNANKLPCISKTWTELRPITDGVTGAPNTDWPESCEGTTLSPLFKGAANGNGEVIKKVNATDGSIGYGGTADGYQGITGDSVVVELQNNGQGPASTATFASAATGTEVANCLKTKYEVPLGARFKGGEPVVNVDWSQVFGAQPSIGGTSYPLCTLTYALGMVDYSSAGFKFGQWRTVYDYLKEYVTAPAGQSDINSKYYAALPTETQSRYNVLGAAGFAAGKMRF